MPRIQKFVPPTLEEVRSYVATLRTYFTGDQFYDYYSGIGWKFKNRRIYDWRAIARFWAGNAKMKKEVLKHRTTPVQQQQNLEEDRHAWEKRADERKANAVSYEEYKRMKERGEVGHFT